MEQQRVSSGRPESATVDIGCVSLGVSVEIMDTKKLQVSPYGEASVGSEGVTV